MGLLYSGDVNGLCGRLSVREDLENESELSLFDRKNFPSPPSFSFSFSVSFEIIRCNRPLFLGVSNMGGSGMSGGPWAKKSMRSRAPADTGYFDIRSVDVWRAGVEGCAVSSGPTSITSSKSKDSLLRVTCRVGGRFETGYGDSL